MWLLLNSRVTIDGIGKLVNFVLVPLGNMVVGISSAFRGGIGGASMDDGVVGFGGISMMAGSAGVFQTKSTRFCYGNNQSNTCK